MIAMPSKSHEAFNGKSAAFVYISLGLQSHNTLVCSLNKLKFSDGALGRCLIALEPSKTKKSFKSLPSIS